MGGSVHLSTHLPFCLSVQPFFLDTLLWSRHCVGDGAGGRELSSSDITGTSCFLFFKFTPSLTSKAQVPSYLLNIFFPFVFLALGFLALQPTKFFGSNMGFLIEAKCSLSCKDKQNISKDKCHLRNTDERIYFLMLCIIFGSVPLFGRIIWRGKGRPNLSP